jgi:integrase
MNGNEAIPSSSSARRQPWNKGKLIGAKPPLRASHVWSIRTRLQLEGRTRDLALFNLAIDSKLRGCDVVAVRVDDMAPNGYTLDRATVRQKKTGRPVRFELTEQTRQAIDEYLRMTRRKPGEFLFAGRGTGAGLTTRQYARLVGQWITSIGLDRLGKPALNRRFANSACVPSNILKRAPSSMICRSAAFKFVTHPQAIELLAIEEHASP